MKTILPYHHELIRKAIHISSIWMVFAVMYLSYNQYVMIFFIVSIFMIFYEYIRRSENFKWGFIYKIIFKINKCVLRDKEVNGLTGATYLVLTTALCAAIFPHQCVAIALLVTLIGDAAAAIFGRKYGAEGVAKSWVGSMAFFFFSFISVVCFGKIEGYSVDFLMTAAFISLVGMFIERCEVLDDNFTVMLGVSFLHYSVIKWPYILKSCTFTKIYAII